MKLVVAMALVFIGANVCAQTAGIGDLSGTSDAEGFHSVRLRNGAMFEYASPFEYNGVALQATHYAHSDWAEEAPAVVFLHRRQRREDLAGTIAEVGLIRVAGRTRILGDASWTLRPNERTGVQFIGAADVVETRRALEDGTVYTFTAASVERQLGQRLTLIALGGYQHFTDGNNRLHARGRAIWALLPEEGVYAQVRWRGFESGELDVDQAYFNPERYSELDAGLYLRRRLSRWVLFGAVAAGREWVRGIDSRTTGSVDLRAEGPLVREMRLVFHMSYSRSAGFAIADDYWYGRAGITLIIPIP